MWRSSKLNCPANCFEYWRVSAIFPFSRYAHVQKFSSTSRSKTKVLKIHLVGAHIQVIFGDYRCRWRSKIVERKETAGKLNENRFACTYVWSHSSVRVYLYVSIQGAPVLNSVRETVPPWIIAVKKILFPAWRTWIFFFLFVSFVAWQQIFSVLQTVRLNTSNGLCDYCDVLYILSHTHVSIFTTIYLFFVYPLAFTSRKCILIRSDASYLFVLRPLSWITRECRLTWSYDYMFLTIFSYCTQ